MVAQPSKQQIPWSFLILFFIPLWLPILYLVLAFVELKITTHGPLNNLLGIFALFAAPAIGSFSIISLRSIPVVLKIILVPIYYFFGLFGAGIIGWSFGCGIGVVGCH